MSQMVKLLEAGANPIQRALNDYHMMEAELSRTRAENQTLRAESQGHLAEVNMLREALERADSDRIRLQAISSTLLGRLLAINDCIGGAVKASIKDGIEATHAAKAEDELEQENELERAGAEVRGILQRVPPAPAPIVTPARQAPPEPPQVDWSRPPSF
jgi:hypothetical protein